MFFKRVFQMRISSNHYVNWRTSWAWHSRNEPVDFQYRSFRWNAGRAEKKIYMTFDLKFAARDPRDFFLCRNTLCANQVSWINMKIIKTNNKKFSIITRRTEMKKNHCETIWNMIKLLLICCNLWAVKITCIALNMTEKTAKMNKRDLKIRLK